MSKLFSILFQVILLLWVCKPLTAQQIENIEDILEDLNEKRVELTLSGQYSALGQFYTEDAISLPNFGKVQEGIPEIIRFAEEAADMEFKVVEMKFKPIEIHTAENLVIELGSLKLKITGPGIPGKVADKGKYMTLWERQDNGMWKIKAETWNTDVNPLDRMPKMENDRKKRKVNKGS
jgi:ketosteroid isomerase-like protein